MRNWPPQYCRAASTSGDTAHARALHSPQIYDLYSSQSTTCNGALLQSGAADLQTLLSSQPRRCVLLFRCHNDACGANHCGEARLPQDGAQALCLLL